uniref:Uncharacterized protein n=1 Tax=Rhizophora mucronata TaxID=61149 RepID=A0A2P2PSQ1_RHIMU
MSLPYIAKQACKPVEKLSQLIYCTEA